MASEAEEETRSRRMASGAALSGAAENGLNQPVYLYGNIMCIMLQ